MESHRPELVLLDAMVLFAHDFEPYVSAERVAQVAGDGIWIATRLDRVAASPRQPGRAADDG